ncbi:LuxR C-terminal-related transcriptional regulator [Phytohalomonas tamaricis]|uniref:LuxR C-terminal-related transcriptional regulator n=1 Tax=Phytohalomonas tamaricis TaxID=2081032 RepID=UPI002948C38F|nr:LuxR C-terminal-related transcriptional regulator [Phytohalomonas tamaricis]
MNPPLLVWSDPVECPFRIAIALRRPMTQTGPSTEHLTQRERDILRLLVKGQSNKQIGQQLDITEGTVKVHVRHLLKNSICARAPRQQFGQFRRERDELPLARSSEHYCLESDALHTLRTGLRCRG